MVNWISTELANLQFKFELKEEFWKKIIKQIIYSYFPKLYDCITRCTVAPYLNWMSPWMRFENYSGGKISVSDDISSFIWLQQTWNIYGAFCNSWSSPAPVSIYIRCMAKNMLSSFSNSHVIPKLHLFSSFWNSWHYNSGMVLLSVKWREGEKTVKWRKKPLSNAPHENTVLIFPEQPMLGEDLWTIYVFGKN